MNATELFLLDGKSSGVWYCAECHVVHSTQGGAEQCCRPYTCSECGIETTRYRTVCSKCMGAATDAGLRAKYEKAEKRNGWEWSGPVVTDNCEGYHDGYFHSADDLRDWLDDNDLTFADVRVYATQRVGCRMSAENIIESMCEDLHEGAFEDIPTEAHDKLQSFLDAWVEEYAPVSYEGDYSVALEFPEPEGTKP